MKLQMRLLFALFLPVLLPVVTYAFPASATVTETMRALTSPELAKAAADFNTYCSVCHGRDATGNGPVAEELKTPPADLTRIAARSGGVFHADAVFKTIEGLDMPLAHGTSEMPIWGALFVRQAVGEGVLIEDAKTAARVATDRIKRLVRYLETIQEK
ncbi:cytochrome c [Anderseniella sp. Alg231-50]|uniref:cytochrome c n=1 Tax=Anderseniella sp. Alg231-50 TaxID=1922226 RepID=UPI000D554C89